MVIKRKKKNAILGVSAFYESLNNSVSNDPTFWNISYITVLTKMQPIYVEKVQVLKFYNIDRSIGVNCEKFISKVYA